MVRFRPKTWSNCRGLFTEGRLLVFQVKRVPPFLMVIKPLLFLVVARRLLLIWFQFARLSPRSFRFVILFFIISICNRVIIIVLVMHRWVPVGGNQWRQRNGQLFDDVIPLFIIRSLVFRWGPFLRLKFFMVLLFVGLFVQWRTKMSPVVTVIFRVLFQRLFILSCVWRGSCRIRNWRPWVVRRRVGLPWLIHPSVGRARFSVSVHVLMSQIVLPFKRSISITRFVLTLLLVSRGCHSTPFLS